MLTASRPQKLTASRPQKCFPKIAKSTATMAATITTTDRIIEYLFIILFYQKIACLIRRLELAPNAERNPNCFDSRETIVQLKNRDIYQ